MINIISSEKSEDHYVAKEFFTIMLKACELAHIETRVVQYGDRISKKDWVIVHNSMWAYSLIVRGFKKIIMWMPGATAEESFMRNHSYVRYFILGHIDKVLMRNSKYTIFVSDYLHDLFEKKYHLRINDYYVMPCFNELKIQEESFYEDKYNNNVFTYVGSLSEWQCFSDTVRLYKQIEDCIHNTKLLVLTPDKEKARNIIKKEEIMNYEVDFVPQVELSNRLKHVKYGFILRKDDPVNNVATPTKMSTYLSNGVIPIYSDAIVDFAKIFGSSQFAIKLDSKADISLWKKEICNHISENTIDLAEIKRCYKKVFNTYYSCDYHAKRISKDLCEIVK